MTTKEFIEMLQKEDPTGEGHIRMHGGVPKYAESKPGYWDGPYQYIDKDGNFVTSINGYKVDIRCVDLDDFVSDETDMHDINNWEDIESKIKFEFGGYADPNQRREKEKAIIESARETWEEMRGIQVTSYNRGLEEMRANAEKGWSWFQNKLVDTEGRMHHYYTWKIYDENGKDQGSNVWHTESIKKSGEWERVDNNVLPGYYQWIKKGREHIKPSLPIKEQIRNKVGILKKIKNVLMSK